MPSELFITVDSPGAKGGMAIDVVDEDGNILKKGIWVKLRGGRFGLRLTPADFEEKERVIKFQSGECPFDDCHGDCCVTY